MHIWVNDIDDKIIIDNMRDADSLKFGRGKKRYEFVYQTCGFDIETTQIITDTAARAYMYIWSFTFNELTILGSTWPELLQLLEVLKRVLDLKENKRLLIYIANTSFEFQFMRKWLNITKSFFNAERSPLYFIHDYCFEFRDALQLSGGRLEDLARNYTKTQKLVDDLDYSIKRNKTDGRNMKGQELQYVINDTVILSEYMDYVFRTFGKSNKIPLTKTGILRNEVTQDGRRSARKAGHNISNIIAALHPNIKLYKVMMDYLFRGGYVHGTNTTAGVMLHNLAGVDIVSSYPFHMNAFDNYPVGVFLKCDQLSLNDYLDLNKTYATMALIRFTNIRTTTAHTIESINKTVYCNNYHLDNGRILDAETLEVFLTDLDFDIYQKFYAWDNIEIKKCWKAVRGPLPRYLLNNLNKHYTNKSVLKRRGLSGTTNYILAKQMVNSAYGLTVTRMRENKIIYINELDIYDIDSQFVFDAEVEKQVLLPQWGIWVTANARHTLLDMVYKIEMNARKHGRKSDCVYMDTDSIKILHYKDHKHIIDQYNKWACDVISNICDKFALNKDDFIGLGTFELELPYIKTFKHLGAKRYLMKFYDFKNREYKTKATIAGLPKKALTSYCSKKHLSVWKVFNDNMNIPIQEAGKLASVYNDEPHTDVVNGEVMEELSSVCLVPIEFTLTVKDYLQYILEAEKRLKEGLI